MSDSTDELLTALQEVVEAYGIRMTAGEHAAIARHMSRGDRAVLQRQDVAAAFDRVGLRAPGGFARDLLARWSLMAPPKELSDILLEYRLDAIDALSAEFGGKPKSEETLRNNLRMYLKGRHHVESRTAKGRTDILLPARRAIIETKVWTARQKFEDGLDELGEYIRTVRPPTREAAFVLFCDDTPLPEVVPAVDQAIVDVRRLNRLDVPVIAVPFQVVAPSKKAYERRRRS